VFSNSVRAIVGAIFRRPTQSSIVIELHGDTVTVESGSLSQPQIEELAIAMRRLQKDSDVPVSLSVRAESGSSAKLLKHLKEILGTEEQNAPEPAPAETDESTKKTGEPS